MSDDLTDLATDLATAGPEMDAITDALLKDRSDAMVETAKSLVAVESGDLRDSLIGVTGEQHERLIMGKFYGMFVEYGTARAGPKPFINPAVDKHLDELEDLLLQAGTAQIVGEGVFS